jgi:hypothetical protein
MLIRKKQYMQNSSRIKHQFARAAALIALTFMLSILSSRMQADTGTCVGQSLTLPFTDVSGSIFFCQIAEAYFSGLTLGTDPTHYSPSLNTSRDQMAAFITRAQDSAIKRSSRRAALDQWWTPAPSLALPSTTVGIDPRIVRSDGADLWVANYYSDTVSRVRASDGALLGTWTGASEVNYVLVAEGYVYALAVTSPNGKLYLIDPTQPPGPVTTLTSSLGDASQSMAFDGTSIWTANYGGHNFSKVSHGLFGTTVTNITNSVTHPDAIIYDGSNMWVTDFTTGAEKIAKLDPSDGHVLLSVPVGQQPGYPVFDGTNIWVPCSNSVTVIRASTGAVIATLTGNGLDEPFAAAFDGERIAVTNWNGGTISLWKATSLTPLGSFRLGIRELPQGICSDGLNFWIALPGVPTGNPGRLGRF